MIAAKPKANEIVDRINALVCNDAPVAAWYLLLDDIQKLKKTDAADAWGLEGVVRARVQESAEAMYAFQNAVKLEPNKYSIRSNFSIAAGEMGYLHEAFVQADRAYQLTEGSKVDAWFACGKAFDSGNFFSAEKYLELSKRLKVEEIQTKGTVVTCIEQCAQISKSRGWSDNVTSGYVESAFEVFREKLRRPFKSDISVGNDDGEGFISLILDVAKPIDFVADMNRTWISKVIGMSWKTDLLTTFAITARSSIDDGNSAE